MIRRQFTLLVALCGVALGLLVVAGAFGGCVDQHAEAERLKRNHERARWAIDDLVYLRDPRTDLCFAYGWRGASDGGPMLAHVPREACK